jgi:hypothetical protein
MIMVEILYAFQRRFYDPTSSIFVGEILHNDRAHISIKFERRQENPTPTTDVKIGKVFHGNVS